MIAAYGLLHLYAAYARQSEPTKCRLKRCLSDGISYDKSSFQATLTNLFTISRPMSSARTGLNLAENNSKPFNSGTKRYMLSL